jgi:hypothetical protein
MAAAQVRQAAGRRTGDRLAEPQLQSVLDEHLADEGEEFLTQLFMADVTQHASGPAAMQLNSSVRHAPSTRTLWPHAGRLFHRKRVLAARPRPARCVRNA